MTLQIFSIAKHSIHLELAITALEQYGIPRHDIFAVPLDNPKVRKKLFDSLQHSDGSSLLSTGAALATAFAVVGASVGFSLSWGPIYWGLITAFSGFMVGFLIDLTYARMTRKRRGGLRSSPPQVVLIIQCEQGQADAVEQILWRHFSLGTARVGTGPVGMDQVIE